MSEEKETVEAVVKVWETDSIHPTFEKADARRKSLEGTVGKEAVKVRKRGRGFMVKLWHGKTKSAPKRKTPNQQPSQPLLV